MLRKKLLLAMPDHVVSVARYQPGEHHPPHVDRHSRISFLLRGSCREDVHAGSFRMTAGDMLLKSSSAVHADQFGGEGAVLASVEFLADDPFEGVRGPGFWSRRMDAPALRHMSALIEAARAGDSGGVQAAVGDIVAAGLAREDRPVAAPRWLLDLRDEVEAHGLAGIDIGARARLAGVHPVHVSRLFRRCFGTTISEHAGTHGVRRALALLVRPGVSLSEAALGAGFYDQSHMNRVFRRVVGRTPGGQRALLSL